MSDHVADYQIRILSEEVVARREQIDRLRGSAAWRIGEIAIALRTSPARSIGPALEGLRRLALLRSRSKGFRGNQVNESSLDEVAMRATVVIFGTELPDWSGEGNSWSTTDERLLNVRLDSGGPPGTLILCLESPGVARRVGRLKRHGWRIIWSPRNHSEQGTIAEWVEANADELWHRSA